jgi:membrane protease YdiL (CAAX protease family)
MEPFRLCSGCSRGSPSARWGLRWYGGVGREPRLFAFGALLAVAWVIGFANTLGDHHRFLLQWLFGFVAAIGVVRIAWREVPRSSWPFLALLVPRFRFGSRSVLMLVAFAQIAWVFAASRRPLVRRRDLRATFEPRRRLRERIELAAVLLVAVVYPIARHMLVASSPVRSRARDFVPGIFWEVGMGLMVLCVLLGDPAFHPYVPRNRRGWLYECGFALWLFLLAGQVEDIAADAARLLQLPVWPNYWSNLQYTPAIRGVLVAESLFSAFYEEVVFRAFLVTRLRPLLRDSTAWTVVVSSALFALMHGYSPRGTVSVFAFSCVMAAVYVRSRSLTRLVLAHWLTNAVSFLAGH